MKKSAKRYRTILNGLDRGTIILNQNPKDPAHKLYKKGLKNER